jgi:NAD(P)-dependent dehydrogenase (short-subunit alcohol dehydrogenase family)
MADVAGLTGQVVIVTGASRGIGRAIARALANEGARVAGCGRDARAPSFLDDLSAEARARCLFTACDIRSSQAVHAFRDAVASTMGPAHVVVNNAGIVARHALAQLPEETWNDVLASNLTGTFLVTQAFLPAMQSLRRGKIINLSSIAGRSGTPLLSAYCAAKHGVVGLTRAWAEELRPDGITVNAICPGSVDTDMLQQGMPGGVPKMTADEIARVAVFLACEAPPALTGACIDVFG